MSEDRLIVLGGEYFDAFVQPNLRAVGLDLVKEARRQGRRVVLVSELLDVIVAPLVDLLGADELLCNHMEIDRGTATGRLVDPVIGGPISGQWAKQWARERSIDLERSAGYGARSSDSLLLSAVGQPCAVFPDRRLRRIAKDLDWPIVEG
jgi:phosphoserine phosphatase